MRAIGLHLIERPSKDIGTIPLVGPRDTFSDGDHVHFRPAADVGIMALNFGARFFRTAHEDFRG